jgi:CubicO group peptidase (beta-lactamase class C family)
MLPSIRRFAPLVLVLILALSAAWLGGDSLVRAAGVPTHYLSHQLCSAVFVGGLDPDEFYRDGIEREIAPAGPFISYRIDRARAEVTASFVGLVTSRAVYRGSAGCQIVPGEERAPPILVESNAAAPSLLPPIAGRDVVEPTDTKLKTALDEAFAEPDHPPYRRTKAVVIVHDGKIVAERYASGYGIDTPLIGWSMTKSVNNALLGILVREHKLAVDDRAAVAAWSDPGDPRRDIKIDNLLRMTSGLDLGQSLGGDWRTVFDPSAQMEFAVPDMAAFAEGAKLKAQPGTHWTYANGDTMLLSRIIRDKVGGDAASVIAFARRELFDKLGMQHATLEFDGAGTPIGSSHMWATARDWARFGLLFLNDGVVGGERILPQGWVDYSARLTPGSEDYGYGAGFWTNRGASPAARIRVQAGMPDDSFMARGIQGQYVVVIPSAKLVIVRLGMAYTPRGDMAVMGHLAAAAVTATKAE